ncbi:hypothetical protein IL54_3370 [Sphingobium sp. ba1]|nr:hypothetical protein IL54_3370 [Sphingobium sp. ba1]
MKKAGCRIKSGMTDYCVEAMG